MVDETKDLEPQQEEAPEVQEETPPEVAPEVEEPAEKEPAELSKALKEARRDAKKEKGRRARVERELEELRKRLTLQAPPQVLSEQEKDYYVAEYQRMKIEEFIQRTVEEAGLERDDPRLDDSSDIAFIRSVALAVKEDAEEKMEQKEKEVKSLGEKIRAEAKKELEVMKRDLRRELRLDQIAKPTPTATSDAEAAEAAIRAEYEPQLKKLRGSGQTSEAMRLIREMEAKIAEAHKKQQ